MSLKDDLLPCPFCGANAGVKDQDSNWTYKPAVICRGCGSVMVGRDLQDARERWNSRADRMEVLRVCR